MSEPDRDILQHIRGLVDEEHALRSSGQPDSDRLRHLEEQPDQEFDQDPADAAVRPESTVEGYQQ